jgi:hypothetical protein
MKKLISAVLIAIAAANANAASIVASATNAECQKAAEDAVEKIGAALGLGEGVVIEGGAVLQDKVHDKENDDLFLVYKGSLGNSANDYRTTGASVKVEVLKTAYRCVVSSVQMNTGAAFRSGMSRDTQTEAQSAASQAKNAKEAHDFKVQKLKEEGFKNPEEVIDAQE